MKKHYRMIWLISGALVVAGAILFGIGWLTNGGTSTVGADYLIYDLSDTVSGDVRSLRIDADTANVYLIPGDSLRYEIHVELHKDSEPTVTLDNGTLKIAATEKPLSWHVSFDWSRLVVNEDFYIKVYYPREMEFDRVTISDALGSVDCDGLFADYLDIDASNGSVRLNDLFAGEVSSFELSLGSLEVQDSQLGRCKIDNSNGSVTLKSVYGVISLDVQQSLGSFSATDCVLREVSIDNSNGSVTLKNVYVANFAATLSMGSAKLSGTFYGTTKIDNSNGSIELNSDLPASQYGYTLETSMGSVYVDGREVKGGETVLNSGAPNTLDLSTSMGSVSVNFAKE